MLSKSATMIMGLINISPLNAYEIVKQLLEQLAAIPEVKCTIPIYQVADIKQIIYMGSRTSLMAICLGTFIYIASHNICFMNIGIKRFT